MISIDKLIFGYVDIKLPPHQLAIAADILLKGGITAKISSEGRMRLSALLWRRARILLSGKVEYTVISAGGLFGLLKKSRSRYGLFSALLISALLFLCLYGVVWDVRIEGVDEATAEEVLRELSDCGLHIGRRWSRIDKSEVEVNTLKISDSVSWVNINRRGCVAYVTAVKKQVYEEEVLPGGYANLVAACDCIIEEIIVERGVAVVKAGQTVKKGQLLISGVIPTELGGGTVYASGSVRGRYSERVEVTVADKGTEKVSGTAELCGISVKIFDFSINIFQRYRNFDNDCDIIEEKREISLRDGKRLPFGLALSYARPYTLLVEEYTPERQCELAAAGLREELLCISADRELLRARTEGGFLDGAYRMTAELLLSGEVGEIREFDLENK